MTIAGSKTNKELIEKYKKAIEKNPPLLERVEVHATAAQLQRGGNMLDASMWDRCESTFLSRSVGDQVWTQVWVEAPLQYARLIVPDSTYFSIELGRRYKLLGESLRLARSEKLRRLGCGACLTPDTTIKMFVEDAEAKKPAIIRVSIFGWELVDALLDYVDEIFPNVKRVP
jgi:hypothetical protein